MKCRQASCSLPQKVNFSAICRMRGSRALVMRPKVLEVTVVFGLFNSV